MEEINLNGKCLYTPKGAAREYAAVGCNFYRGCPYGCAYCYNKRGVASGMLGGDSPVLMSKFTNIGARAKKYAHFEAEDYAFSCFTEEVTRNLSLLMDTGIFFSFTTDPMCLECFPLTWSAVNFAVGMGIPVRILTKNARYNMVQMAMISNVPCDLRKKVSLGFTLTGRDDMERGASKNIERVQRMQQFHDMGFSTFASIEPIVDFERSLSIIRQSTMACDFYMIGLMSGTSRDYYDKAWCERFVSYVDSLLIPRGTKVYWKKSVRDFLKDRHKAMRIINESSVSVSECWI